MEGGEVLLVHVQGGLGKCRVRAPTFTLNVRGWSGGLVGDMWFVRMGGGTSGWFVVCMGNGVESKSMVAHDKTNGRWNYEVWWNMMN